MLTDIDWEEEDEKEAKKSERRTSEKEIEETQEICNICDGVGTVNVERTHNVYEPQNCRTCKGTGYRVTKRIVRYSEW